MSTTTQPFLIRFFDPATQAADAQSRTLPTILSWPDSKLERNHDYIQTLFPLPESSMFAHAPIITPEIRTAFLSRQDLRQSLGKAFDRILAFYGLSLDSASEGELEGEKGPVVTKLATWPSSSPNWLTRSNHNHLRITRILRSLRTLGLPAQARALHTFLSTDPEVLRAVSPTSQKFWLRAAQRPLHLPPDEDDEEALGIEWLREVEG